MRRFKLLFSGSLDHDVLWSIEKAGEGAKVERCRLLANIGILIDQGKVLPLNLANVKSETPDLVCSEVNLILKTGRDSNILDFISGMDQAKKNEAIKERIRIAARVCRNEGATNGAFFDTAPNSRIESIPVVMTEEEISEDNIEAVMALADLLP